MNIVRPLPQAPIPPGSWGARTDWQVSSLDEAFAVRDAARDLVGPGAPESPQDPVYASVGARVELTIGELVMNGLRHGGPPVQASLLRGRDGWLVVVADGAAALPPLLSEVAPEKVQGKLGIRLVVALATSAGWYAADGGKHVWALLADEPSDRLLTALRQRP
jgi:hypothetical protein